MKFLLPTLLFTSLLFCNITTGKIVDADGNPVRGATISHQNTYTHSDKDGTFRLKSSGRGLVTVEHIGYKTINIEHSDYLRIEMQPRVILAENVIITSPISSTAIKNLNSSITIFEPEKIKDIQADHLESHLHQISNLNWSGGSSRPRYFQIRGIGERRLYTGVGQPIFSVGFIIDDIDLSGIGMAGMMFDLNQIEILKGAQSSVFGANALAGSIHLKSTDPKPFWGGQIVSGYGSDNNQRIGFALDTPISSRLMVRTGLFYSAGDGFRENLYLNHSNTNSKSESMVRTKLNWIVSKNLNIKINIMAVELDNKYDAWAPDNNEDFHTYSDRQGYDSQSLSAISFRSSYRYNSGHKLLSISSKSQSDMEHSYDGDWGNNPFWESDPYNWDPVANGYSYDFYDKTLRKRQTLTHELRFLSPEMGKTNYTYAVGVYYKSLIESDLMDGYIFSGDVDRFDGEFDITNMALYGNFNILLDQGIGFDASYRIERSLLDYSSTSLKDLDYDGIYETTYTTEVCDRGEWLAALKGVAYYNLDETDRLFTSFSTGYKAGGVNQNPFISDINKYYDPEQNISFELGYKSFKEESSYQATLFYMLRENLQTSVSAQQDSEDPTSFYYFTSNASSGHNYGVELERSQVFLDNKIKLMTSIGYLETFVDRYEFYTYDSYADEIAVMTRGDRAQSLAPEYTYSVVMDVRPTDKLTLSVDYSYKDSYFFSDSHDYKSDPYQLLHLSAGYKLSNAFVSMWIRNLTNERYAVRGFYFALEPNDFEDKLYLQWGDPLHFGVSFRYDF